MTRTIRQVAALVVLAFFVVGGDLIYWQVFRAPDLSVRAGNPRAVQAEQQIDRGLIVDRRGTVLAQSVRGADGFTRQYAMASLSHVIGYSSIRFGQDGLEKAYDSQLTGSSGDLGTSLVNLILHRPRIGDTLTLTIDARLQQTADEALGPVNGAAIIMKPATGEILAMVSKPYFDANKLDTEIPRLQNDASGALLNRATLGLFPPGSTFKIVTTAEALASNTATPDTRFKLTNDILVVDGFVVRGSNLPRGVSDVNLTEAFQYSCNPCFAQLGLDLGWPKLEEGASRFGVGKPLPFDLPVKQSALYNPGADLSRVLLANTAYGQGQLQVTPLEMLLAGAAIANGGTIPQPHLVAKEATRSGQPIADFGGGSLGSAVDARVAGQVRDMMVTAVDKGSGQLAHIPNVQVAGKTGTAETGDGQNTHAWFVAFAPANQPRYVVVVIREHQGEGADQAAPMAKTMLQAALASGD